MNLRTINLLLIITAAFLSQQCGVYSFTGASISPDIKTLSIQTFFNDASLGPANMSNVFTEKIKDYYVQNTSLRIVDENGDLQIEGAIKNYSLTPIAPSGSTDNNISLSELTRLTISVKASYVNTKDDTFDFDKNFSFFKDFDPESEDLESNEDAFVDEIFNQIVLDIFNASVANW